MHKSFLSCQPVPISWARPQSQTNLRCRVWEIQITLSPVPRPARPVSASPGWCVSRWAPRVPGCHPTSSVKWNIKKQTQRQGLVLWSIRLEWLGDTLVMDLLWPLHCLLSSWVSRMKMQMSWHLVSVTLGPRWRHRDVIKEPCPPIMTNLHIAAIFRSVEREERVSAWCY